MQYQRCVIFPYVQARQIHLTLAYSKCYGNDGRFTVTVES